MKTFIHLFACIVTSLVLALPPGSCCDVTQVDGVETTPVKVACCPDACTNKPSDSDHAPITPAVTCCCVQHAVLPEKSAPAIVAVDLPPVIVTDRVDEQFALLCIVDANNAVVRAGPRLQILFCVWRC
jgi:hypothetical protein